MDNIVNLSTDDIYNRLDEYQGLSVRNENAETLNGKVVTGYQGWFNTPDDGAEHGWYSYDRKGVFKPGSCTIDLWPDVTELDDDEKYATSFTHADGSTAYVYSAYNQKSVVRHFQWMKQYGIDGAFVQRFVIGLNDPVILNHRNRVLMNCRAGANQFGRSYNVMYDLSGITSDTVDLVIHDWKKLADSGISRRGTDQAYQYHNGKPLVTLWGIGFNDNRKYTLEDCMKLVSFFKDDPIYGNNSVMVGVPTGWREQSDKRRYLPKIAQRHTFMDGDAINNELLHEIIKKADVISPWAVDRFDSLEGIEQIAEQVWKKDIAWCRAEGKEFIPVNFPGFSWGNLYQGQSYNQIPRQRGAFLWKQYYELVKIGATTMYQAMFDEVNEGTAFFKCTNNPPVGKSSFIDFEGLESDFYLWLAGEGGKLMRHEIPLTADIPKRK